MRHRTSSFSPSLQLEQLERRELLHGGEIFPTITFETQQGNLTIELFHEDAPKTVQNFLNYVHDGDYQDMFFHRYAEFANGQPFVLQGGGFTVGNPEICDSPCNTSTADISTFAEVPTDPPVANEFGISNTRGTVAMAKLGGDPNSATSQFFVNLGDNGDNQAGLDTQNGGFTVFGQVSDMTVADSISALDNVNLSGRFPGTRLSAIGAAPVFENNNGRTEIVSTQQISGTAVLEGTVFNDFDGDGNLDDGEGGMSSRTIFDDANGNGQLDGNEMSTTTDERGRFHLVVGSGNYDVRMVDATDYGQTVSIANGAYDRTVDIGELAHTLDFGLRYNGTSWTNPLINTDVDGVNGTTPIDALTAINELSLREFSDPDTGALPTLTSTPAMPVFLDVVGNGFFGPLDANLVITNLITSSSPQAVPNAPLSSVVAGNSDSTEIAPLTIQLQVQSDQVSETANEQIANTTERSELASNELASNEVASDATMPIYASASSTSDARDSNQDRANEEESRIVDDIFATLG